MTAKTILILDKYLIPLLSPDQAEARNKIVTTTDDDNLNGETIRYIEEISQSAIDLNGTET